MTINELWREVLYKFSSTKLTYVENTKEVYGNQKCTATGVKTQPHNLMSLMVIEWGSSTNHAVRYVELFAQEYHRENTDLERKHSVSGSVCRKNYATSIIAFVLYDTY